jgi:hypothetical protein
MTIVKKYFEQDHALSRRFQKIDVPPTSTEETLLIAGEAKDATSNNHGVTYTAAGDQGRGRAFRSSSSWSGTSRTRPSM